MHSRRMIDEAAVPEFIEKVLAPSYGFKVGRYYLSDIARQRMIKGRGDAAAREDWSKR